MTTQPPRRYSKFAIAIVVAALVVGAAVYVLFFVGTTATITKSSDSTQDAPLGLTLRLHISANSTGLYIYANETNVLDRVNNVTTTDNWPYPNPDSSACGDYNQFPIQYAVFQGNYDAGNYTSAADLTLYNTADVYMCPTESTPGPYLLFAPLSDNITTARYGINYLVSVHYSTAGYWTGSGSSASFHRFPPGTYSVLAEDEWGNAVLLHFKVSSNL
jgi:hypothetical protein